MALYLAEAPCDSLLLWSNKKTKADLTIVRCLSSLNDSFITIISLHSSASGRPVFGRLVFTWWSYYCLYKTHWFLVMKFLMVVLNKNTLNENSNHLFT